MIKKVFWIVVIGFVGWAFVAWLFSGDVELAQIARKVGGLFGDMREALGIFFTELFG
jgi:hypothetical protein